MSTKPWLFCLLFTSFACSSGSGGPVQLPHNADPSTSAPDAGDAGDDPSSSDAGDGDTIDTSDDGGEGDASSLPPVSGGDAGPADPIGEVIDQVLDITTCKPEEVRPVVTCLTMTCTQDLLMLPGCLLNECAKLIEA